MGERPTIQDYIDACNYPGRIDDAAVEMFNAKDNPLLGWIKVNRPTALEHLRPHDTHEPIMFGVGIYEVRRQREYSPEGWRRVAD